MPDSIKEELNTTQTAPAASAVPYDANQRISEINRMYDSNVNAQKNALTAAYNQNLSDLEANRAKIAQQYQTQRNINAINYERTRRNFNQQAAMNGLNTGAGSQAALALNNQYLGGAAQIGAAEANANTSLEKSIADLKIKYESDVNDAIAKNDYNRAATLLDEYNRAYSQAMTKAQTLAQYGDFSGYSDIYGSDTARQMSETWVIQNPLLAYNLGRIDANRYKAITGTYPPNAKSSGGGWARTTDTTTTADESEIPMDLANAPVDGGTPNATTESATTTEAPITPVIIPEEQVNEDFYGNGNRSTGSGAATAEQIRRVNDLKNMYLTSTGGWF